MLLGVKDERLDQTLRQKDGDTLAREGARDAKAIAQDGNSNHLVLRHLGEELVVRGLRDLKRTHQSVTSSRAASTRRHPHCHPLSAHRSSSPRVALVQRRLARAPRRA